MTHPARILSTLLATLAIAVGAQAQTLKVGASTGVHADARTPQRPRPASKGWT